MYLPSAYKTEDEKLAIEVINKNSLATVVTTIDNEPYISLLPVFYDHSEHKLYSHCARANPHSKLF